MFEIALALRIASTLSFLTLAGFAIYYKKNEIKEIDKEELIKNDKEEEITDGN